MPRTVMVTFADGTQRRYVNAPDTITPQAMQAFAEKDYGQPVAHMDGGKNPQASGRRNVMVTFADGTRRRYANAPANITPQAMQAFAEKDYGQPVAHMDGGRGAAPPPAPPPPTRDQRLTAAGRNLANAGTSGQAGGDFGTAFLGATTRNLFGLPERLAAAGERWLPSSVTGNNSNASYDDILKVIRAKTDAQMGRSTGGNILGTIVGGGAGSRAAAGAVAGVAGKLASASSPWVARAGNFLQNAMTMQKGQKVANAARVVAAGAGGGAAQAAGEGSDVGAGAVKGAAGAAVLGTGFKAAQVLSRPFRDFMRLSSAGQILSRLTGATSDQLADRAAEYRNATGAEPTLFELLPLADRNNILKQAVVGRDNVVEAASGAIRARANNLGPEMSARARAVLEPNRDSIHAKLLDDLETARGGTLAPGDGDLAGRAMNSPTDMSEFRDQEARAIMAPHEATPVAGHFNDILPEPVPQNNNGSITQVDGDPEVTAAIRSAAPAGFRTATGGQQPVQNVTAGDISSMIQTLRGDIGKGGIEGRTAERAIAHLEGVLGDSAPEAAAAHAQMTDAYAARSRMMEGMKEGAATRLRDEVQVGTSRSQARTVRNAYDTPEGTDGRAIGQGNRILTNLEGSPEDALRATVAMSRNGTGRQLAQNVGAEPANDIMAAARAQDTSAQALGAASNKVQSGGDTGNAETLVQALAGLHPSSFITTKAGALRKLADMTYIPENRARTMVDMLFSQNPAMTQRALDAVKNSPNGAQFLQYLGGVTGIASGSSGQAGGQTAEEAAPPAAAPPVDNAAEPAAPAETPPVDNSGNPAQSPYAANLQQIQQTENPDLLALIDRQFHQESGGQQFDANGQPVTSKKGAIGVAQVMPHTAPEAATLAGLPWDERAYQNDGTYNKLLGIAYMSQQLRKYNGDVHKALAAYNAGPDRVDHALGAGDNWLSQLPPETQDYVQRIAS